MSVQGKSQFAFQVWTLSIDVPLSVLKRKNVSVKLRYPHQEPVLQVQEKISKLALSVTVSQWICAFLHLCLFVTEIQ